METFSYISELNAFDAWLMYHELPPSSIALWFALMRISNSLGRRTEFNASLSLLSTKCGQMDERTIRNARKRLVDEGLISFQSRKGLRSAVYTLHLLSVERKEKLETVVEALRSRFGKYAIQPACLCQNIKMPTDREIEIRMPTGMIT